MNKKSKEIRTQIISKIEEMEVGEGFDIKFNDGICVKGDYLTMGVRCAEIIGNVAIIAGGYGMHYIAFYPEVDSAEEIVKGIEKEFIKEYYDVVEMEVF